MVVILSAAGCEKNDSVVGSEKKIISDSYTYIGGSIPENNEATYNDSTKTLYVPNYVFDNYFSTGIENFLTGANFNGAKFLLLMDPQFLPEVFIFETTIERIIDGNHVILKDAIGEDMGQDGFFNCCILIKK